VRICQRILGIWLDSNRRFHKNSVEMLMKCRRALTWIQTYRRIFSSQQRKQVYVSFVQSLMDYHLLPTWPSLTKKDKLAWTRVAYRGARTILGSSTTVSGSIACREAGIQPPTQRFRCLWFKRALRCRRFDSSLQKQVYEKRMKTFNLTPYSKISERLNSSQTLSKLKFYLSQELLEEYKSRFPTGAYLLEGVPPRRLTRSACIAFQFRTETLKTKD